ncbi:exopolysaccharide biosynthesis protein [Acuticoccus sp. MNP-M23]|uniref:exopolysaccharide biosynthesis protein n=1 Tax=Acuticoccus sp. MNP-M23 TaxID=3072793 RepID=UPI00281588C0|nr:exopolysaccharide biosynthesis protein [Acuticoccus sp. MNP-M23]WMS44262.1 exopolysaccharide biosynthesis protein [Acuticoccus sp. MNP-M23]
MAEEPDKSNNLASLLDAIENDTEGEEVAVSDVVASLGQRAFGSLFVITSLVAVLPTGAIPGMSILTGTVMLLLSVQLLFGAEKIWLPRFIMTRAIGRERLVRSLHKAKGWARRIDRVIGPRMEFMLSPPFHQLVAISGIIVSLSMYPLAVVPFGAFPAGLSMLVIGLGLMVRDGLLLVLGIAIGFIGLGIAFTFFPF